MDGSANRKATNTETPERQSMWINEYGYDAVKKKMAAKFQETMRSHGVPKRFLNASLNDFPSKLNNQIRTDAGLYLYGPRGCGKTHALAALMREEILNAEPSKFYSQDGTEGFVEIAEFPLFISVPEFLLKIRSTFRQGYIDRDDYPPDTEADIIEKYSRWEVLYLDDLGSEKASDWALQTLFLLIDRRYSEMLRTVISSNLSLDELADRLDDRISSRIAGMCQVVKMEGSDRRLK